MALAIAGCSGAVVSSVPSWKTPVSQRRSIGSSRSVGGIWAGGIGKRIGIDARPAADPRSDFLRGFSSEEPSVVCEFRAVDGQRTRSSSVRCYGGPRGRGRIVFIPLGQRGGRRGPETYPRREWERREKAQRERIRQMMMETDIRAPWECDMERDADWSKLSLLRELGKRLRIFEEEAAEAAKGGADAKKAESESGPVVVEEGAKSSSEASTYELMKELEKRLKEETEERSEGPESRRERRSGDSRERRFRTGDRASLYERMSGWKKEMREQRSWLEELWRSREEDVEADKTEEGDKDEKRGQSEGVKEELGGRKEGEKKSEEEKDDSSKDFASPTYPQSDGTVVCLKNEVNGAEIYLVGTSHISQKSVAEVREVIGSVKPDFVFLELCRKRYDSMKLSNRGNPMAFVEQVVQMLTNRTMGGAGRFVGIGLASFYKLLAYRGFHPGEEFQVAVEEGRNVGAKIVLGDQDIESTFNRMGNFNLRLSLHDAFKFFGKQVPNDIEESLRGASADEDTFEKMRDRKLVRRFNQEMAKGAPAAYKTLVAERNEIMVKALRNLKGKVVAVVGLAHMDGMEQLWHQANADYQSE